MAYVQYIGYISTLKMLGYPYILKEHSEPDKVPVHLKLKSECYMTTKIQVIQRWTQCHTLIIGFVPGYVKMTREKSTQFPF